MTDFATFWELARHSRGRCPNPRRPAELEWDKAIRRGANPRDIIAGFKGFLAFHLDNDTDPQFVCQTRKFLNNELWEQYLSEPAAKEYLAAPQLKVVS